MRAFPTPWPVNVDAYQAGHYLMIPAGMEDFQCSQGIFRTPIAEDDHRMVSAGLAPFIRLELSRQITEEDLEEAEWFLNDFQVTPGPGVKPYPWPKEMFRRVVEEFGGVLPICISGLPDGQAHYVRQPHLQVWTDVPGMGELVGWIESSLLPYIWTSSTVATRGRRRKQRLLEVYQKCYPSKRADDLNSMIEYKVHDFGRRGAPASQITGIAHLINYLGTDTVDAAYAATVELNDRMSFGACSVPAAAHRTITPWTDEFEAYRHHVERFKDGFISIVADSYDYSKGIRMLAEFAEVIKTAGGYLIGRPDSGDIVETVIEGLEVFERAFGVTRQEIGLKVLRNSGIIQGDTVTDKLLFERLIPAVVEAGYCPSNLAVGMGQELHRCLRSDTEHAYKTCMVGTAEGKQRPVMKLSDSPFKRSLPCPVGLFFRDGHLIGERVSGADLRAGRTGELVVQFDGRPGGLDPVRESFAETRQRCYRSWDALPPIIEDPLGEDVRRLQEQYAREVSG